MSPCSEIDYLAFVSGQTAESDWRATTEHLRMCEDCRRELVEVVAGHAALTASAELLGVADGGVSGVDEGVPLPELQPTTSRTNRRFVAVVASVACVLALLAGWLWWPDGTGRSVVLSPVSGSGSGTVSMQDTGRQADMAITVSGLRPPDQDHFYYAWLFDPATQKMLPLGVVSPDGETHFAVSSDLIARYEAVDISLQADNGNPEHSAESVLRASY